MVCIVLILSSMASAFCVLGIGDTCEVQDNDVEYTSITRTESKTNRIKEIQISPAGFFEEDGIVKQRSEVDNLLEAKMVGQGRVYGCDIVEDSNTKGKCKSIDNKNEKFNVEIEVEKKKNGKYPVWVEKQNKSYKEGKSKKKDKTYRKDVGELDFWLFNSKDTINVKLDNLKEKIHIGETSTTVKLNSNASDPNTQDSYINQFSRDANFDTTNLKLHNRGESPDADAILLINLTRILPEGNTITEMIFDFYETDTGGVNTSYNGYIMNCTGWDETTVTWNSYCGGSGGTPEINHVNELFKVTQVYAAGNRYNQTWNNDQANLLYIKNDYHSIFFDNTMPIDRFSNPGDKESANVWNIFITFQELNLAPTTPALISPANNTNFVTFPTLSWTNSTDGNGDAIKYYLEVDNDPEFGSVDYVNASITEAINPTSDVTSGLTSGQVYYWRVLATDDLLNSSFSQVRFFNHNLSILNTTVEIDTPITSGKDTTIFFNVTFNNDSNFIDNVSANMQYNGSIFEMTQIVSGNLSRFSQEVSVPHNFDSLQMFFNTTLFYGNGSLGYELTGNFTQQINETIFGLCNATLIVPFVNFTIQDEENSSSLKGAIVDSDFNYSVNPDFTNGKSFSFTDLVEKPSYAFCGTPNITLYTQTGIDYKSNDYPQRRYVNTSMILNQSTTIQTLDLLLITSGNSVTFQVVNAAGQPLSGVAATVTRNGGLVESGFTDDAGSITFFLNPDFTYTFTFIKSGFNTFATTLKPTQSTFTITMATAEIVSGNINQDITYTTSPTNDVLDNETFVNFTFEVVSGFFIIQESGFTLVNGSDSTQSIGSATCSGSTGCTSSLNTTTGNFTSISMNFFWKANDTFGNGTRTWRVVKTSAFEGSFALFKKDINNLGDSFDDFTKAILTIFITLIVVGSLTWISGQTAPLAILGEIFATVFFLDMLGVVPRVGGAGAIDHLVTVIIGAIFVIYALNESRRLL